VSETRYSLVLGLMSDGRWHTTMEINAVTRGGSEGCRRLREMRADGHEVEKKRASAHDPVLFAGSTQFVYRLVAKAKGFLFDPALPPDMRAP